MIRASGDTCRPSTWRARPGRWLLGVVLVYGLLPRLVLAALCLWRWRQGRGRLALDLNLPGYAQLREALMPRSERIGVQDAAPEALPQFAAGQLDSGSSGALLVAWSWTISSPGRRPAASVSNAGVLDSRESRNKLLEQLGRFPRRAWPSPAIHAARRTVAAWR
jgi:hypothetical protein